MCVLLLLFFFLFFVFCCFFLGGGEVVYLFTNDAKNSKLYSFSQHIATQLTMPVGRRAQGAPCVRFPIRSNFIDNFLLCFISLCDSCGVRI